jgi:hypothetical protein
MGTFEITGFSFHDSVSYISLKIGTATELFDVVVGLVQLTEFTPAAGNSPTNLGSGDNLSLSGLVELGVDPTPTAEAEKANSSTKRRGRPAKPVAEPGVFEEQTTVSVERFTTSARAGEVQDAPSGTAAPVPLAAPTELAAASTFTHVMKWMIANGFRTQEAVQTECARYRDSVPVLQRLAGDVSDRINRALTVLVP